MSGFETAEILPAETLPGAPSRWQLPNFDAALARPPTAEQSESIEAAAYQDGFQRGQSEGFTAGQQAVLQQAQRLQSLVDHIMRPLAHLDEEVERALVDLAGAIARRLLWQMLGAKNPEDAFRLESKALFVMGGGADAHEGVTSFLEKRPARYTMSVAKDFPDFLDE